MSRIELGNPSRLSANLIQFVCHVAMTIIRVIPCARVSVNKLYLLVDTMYIHPTAGGSGNGL